jgi:hypothetical protein
MAISHLGVFSKSTISSLNRLYIVQQIRGNSALAESIGNDLLIDGKSENDSTQGSREDALSYIGVWEEGRGRQMGRVWQIEGRVIRDVVFMLLLPKYSQSKNAGRCSSFVIQKIIVRKLR